MGRSPVFICLAMGLSVCWSLTGCAEAEPTASGRQVAPATAAKVESEQNTKAESEDNSTDSVAVGASSQQPEAGPGGHSSEVGDIDITKAPEPKPKPKDDHPIEDILCQDGLRVANATGHADYTRIFATICTEGAVNKRFQEVLATAYDGANTPSVTVVERETNDMYVTSLLFLYAIKVPLNGPKEFADMQIYQRLDGRGIDHERSRLQTDVESREQFPGGSRVEKVQLQHHLLLAEGAALYDKRHTEINNYLLVETTRDITLSTEHLLDADNEHYHLANGILVGLKGTEAGYTNLMYVNELVVKNRIDPKRMTNTILNLSKSVQQAIYEEAEAVGQ